ncbi:TetR/AcrR family transcriptional regulator [Marinobacterium jannaschii]|uniref:TetR/AcrR family transcriptional regulator n=1 Tax=Marinobacterium jannaschii TaxID=64970 RepID=UPI00068598D2|nr:TetR/AcrR family transcriptional regulator [Marinobacterium jannaschii]
MARGRPSKKQQILDTARSLFADFGYQGTSIDLVVQRAGVSKPTVYNNFSTKQAMLLELLPQMLGEISAARQQIDNDTEMVAGIIESFRQLVQRNDWLAIYRIAWGERHKMEPEVYAQLGLLEQQQEQWIGQWLEEKQGCRPDSARLFMIRALCREAVIVTTLSAQLPDYPALERQLASVLIV